MWGQHLLPDFVVCSPRQEKKTTLCAVAPVRHLVRSENCFHAALQPFKDNDISVLPSAYRVCLDRVYFLFATMTVNSPTKRTSISNTSTTADRTTVQSICILMISLKIPGTRTLYFQHFFSSFGSRCRCRSATTADGGLPESSMHTLAQTTVALPLRKTACVQEGSRNHCLLRGCMGAMEPTTPRTGLCTELISPALPTRFVVLGLGAILGLLL